MANGFFLGGLAQGFDSGLSAAGNFEYQQGLLKLAQQREQNAQQNEQRNRYMQLRADAVTHLQETVTALKNAHPDWTDMQLASNPAVQSLKSSIGSLDQNLGLPSTIDSIVAGMVAGKSQIQTEGALARAKEGPSHQALVQSEINKNNALAGIDVNNPDRPGTGANPPALGQKPQAGTSNGRFAQTATTEAPKVLSWGDARAQLSQKYDPNIVSKAELWLKGNPSIVSGLRGGRGSEREKVQNVAMELGRLVGMSPDEINQNFVTFAGKKAAATSGGRTAGAREANLGIILTAADSAIDAAITASDNVPRSDFTPLNSGVQWVTAKFSSEPLKVFQQKNLQLADLWAKSFNPTGALRVDDRNLALDVLNTAIGNGTYKAAAQSIRDSIGLEKGAAIKFLKERGFSTDNNAQEEDSGSEPGPGGVKVHGFTFTPTSQ